jgi:protein SCO1
MRRFGGMRLALVLGWVLALAGCGQQHKLSQQDIDSSHTLPKLAFTLTDTATARPVTAADFRGDDVLLYFGYTNCPNVCPTTLYDLARMMRQMGKAASRMRVLFVTVDPNRDTPEVLRQYAALFSKQVIGLRGTPAQLAAVAGLYHAAYSVTPASPGHPYAVTHTAAVYAFGPQGKPKFIIAGLSSTAPDYKGIEADLRWLARTG